MIVDRIHALLAEDAARRTQRPNPSGSRLGACTAHLQHLVFPDLTQPEPFLPRGVLSMEAGKLHGPWISQYISRAYPLRWGMAEQPFYFPIPVSTEWQRRGALDVIASRLKSAQHAREPRSIFWGWPIDDFRPPKIEKNPATGKHRITGQFIRDLNKGDQWFPSVVLDRKNATVYVVTYVDSIVNDETFGLTVIENKDMSDWGFRRAMLGDLEYRYRCQLLATTQATGFDNAMWICYRKHTSHLCEVLFSKSLNKVRICLTAPNGSQEVFFVVDALKGMVERDAIGHEIQATMPLPDQSQWDVAQTWTPYGNADLATIYDRVLQVLTVPAPPLTTKDGAPALPPVNHFRREYGPTFTCRKCAGEGSRACSNCKGSGYSLKTKKPQSKPCVWCTLGGTKAIGKVGRVRCAHCEGRGLLTRVQLPAYPCGYCSTAAFCWAPAKMELVVTSRPERWVNYDDFIASGIEVHPPEPLVMEPEAESEEEDEAEA